MLIKVKTGRHGLLMRFLWWRHIITFKLNFCPHKYVFKRFFFFARDDQRFCQNCFQKGPIVKNATGILMEHWNLINDNTMKMAVSLFWITSILGGVFSAAKKCIMGYFPWQALPLTRIISTFEGTKKAYRGIMLRFPNAIGIELCLENENWISWLNWIFVTFESFFGSVNIIFKCWYVL